MSRHSVWDRDDCHPAWALNRMHLGRERIEDMRVRIGCTEWPSITAWAKDLVLCGVAHHHDWESASYGDMSYCARCGHPEVHHASGTCVWRTAAVCDCHGFKPCANRSCRR